MWNAGLDEAQAGIKIAGRIINNLRYTDDSTLIAESKEELKSFLMKVKEESEKAGLKQHSKQNKKNHGIWSHQFSSVQSLSHVRLFVIPWTAAHQASLSVTNSQSLLKLMTIESVMPSKYLTGHNNTWLRGLKLKTGKVKVHWPGGTV